MRRINEEEAAKKFVKDLLKGDYPLERSKNDGGDYAGKDEDKDTKAVKEFASSELFDQFMSV